MEVGEGLLQGSYLPFRCEGVPGGDGYGLASGWSARGLASVRAGGQAEGDREACRDGDDAVTCPDGSVTSGGNV